MRAPSLPRPTLPLMLGLALATPGVLPAQATAALGAPESVLAEPFSQLRGVRELASGALLVTDWLEQRLVLVDPGFRTATRLGRIGAGPQEYRLPSTLLPMAADSTLLVDLGNARLAVLAPDGRIARVVPADQPGLASPGGVDDRGRLYFAMPAWARGPSALPEDSIEVFRHDPRTGRTARVAIIRGMTPAANRGPRLTPGFPMIAFAPQDLWRVSPAGEVVIVRSGDYRVERVGDAGSRSGPAYRYDTEPIRPADRTHFVREFMARAPTSGRGPDGGMGLSPVPSDDEVARIAAANEFAATLPMFDAAVLAPDGELWVQRGRHAGAAVRYDRFNPAGVRIGQVTVTAERRVVGIGQRFVYLAATDQDGLETLERHLRPR